ncbi:nucleotide-diphospho-sugar transferase [Aspergillus terreus]|uniref:Nucleotide-diphospho-sugar transferase n=1 Tax=Aspergillus terreus TaxID=33178 RepID=A0A8H3N4R6_ASPTE|nr:nucleotide-diphospho-sugar transferase [Aspergillus terreus]
MAVLLGRSRQLTAVVILFLVVFAILQFSYTDDFALAGRLSESLWKTTDVREYSTTITASRESWRDMLEPSNYTVKLWTDDDVLDLIKTDYTWLLSTYEGYPHDIQRADIARLLIVHAEGGIYSDLDVYPSSAEHIQCLQRLGLEAIFSPTAGTLGLSNHFFMARPGSPFLQWVLYEAKRRSSRLASRGIVLPYLQVFWSTGPIMVTAAFRQYAWLYDTLRLDIGLLDDGFGGLVVRHAAGRSWQGVDGRALNYIADHAGMEVILTVAACFLALAGLVYAATGSFEMFFARERKCHDHGIVPQECAQKSAGAPHKVAPRMLYLQGSQSQVSVTRSNQYAAPRHDTPDQPRAGADGSRNEPRSQTTRDTPGNIAEEWTLSGSPHPLQFNMRPSDALHALGGASQHLNMIDLQMLSHFMLHTAKNMSLSPRRRHIWETVIPEFAMRNEALMHLLLALAGLDLFSSDRSVADGRHPSPAGSSPAAANHHMDAAYLTVVIEHHQQGLKAFREELSNLSSSTIHHAFAGSMLIVGFALASLHIRNLSDGPLSETHPLQPRLDWISLIQGLGTVVRQHWPELRVGPLRDMTYFIYNNDDWRMYPRETFVGVPHRPCSARIAKFCGGACDALMNLRNARETMQSNPCLLEDQGASFEQDLLSKQNDALDILEQNYMRVLYVVRLTGGASGSSLDVEADLEDAAVMAWPELLPGEFLATLNKVGMLSNLSYVILAYFHLIFSLLESFWYIKDGFDEEIMKIKALIEKSGDRVSISLMQWPVSVIST